MKAVVIANPGQGVEAWKVESRAVPTPGPDQVLVRVRAASLNYRDLAIARGHYGGPARPGIVALSDAAGEIAGLGSNVTSYRVGERVASAYYPTWQTGSYRPEYEGVSLGIAQNDGVLAEYALLSANGIVRIPERLSFEQAATLPCAAVTAWQALFAGAKPLLPGAQVVVQGTGGVSLFAAQLALASGQRVIATSSSPAKIERLRALGIHDVIDYQRVPQWHAEVQKLTGGHGADLVIDVGGAATLPNSMQAARNGARIALVGLLGGVTQTVDPLPILFRTLTVEGLHVGSVEMFEGLLRAMEHSKLLPIIDQVFELEQAPQAFRSFAAAKHFGKIVIRLS